MFKGGLNAWKSQHPGPGRVENISGRGLPFSYRALSSGVTRYLNPWTNLILNPSFPLPPLCLFNRFVSSPLLSSFAFPSLRKAWNFLDAYLRLPYVSFLMSDYFVLRCCPDEKIHVFTFEKWGSDILGTVDFSHPAHLLLRHLVWDNLAREIFETALLKRL